jgi:hypothetical protein
MEEWRKILNFPNYSVSNLGNVKNNKTNKLMKINVKGGYCNISLQNETSKKCCKVHRLVALAFISNPENKSDVNHEDKNKLNNNIENLTWMTPKENNQHKSNGLVYKSNKNKPIIRLDKINGDILEKYNSIEDAGTWAFENKLTKTSHNGRNAIGNCVNGLSNSAYGFRWEYEKKENKNNEEWREINLQNLLNQEILTDKKYFVSSLGRFKNSYGTIMENYKVNENGYIRIYIHKKTFALHRIVAITFFENPEKKEQVNHKDGNKLNNKVENLEFVTNKENQIHKFQNGLGNNYTRKVLQYDLNWVFIKEYNSIVLASKEMNISKGTIQGVLLGNRKTAAGFIWKYADDENINFSEKITINKNIGRKVCQYDLNMNLIKIHNSTADASRNVNVHKNNIWAVIKNNKKSAGGFIWKYLD